MRFLLPTLLFSFVSLGPARADGVPARFTYPAGPKNLYEPQWRRDFVRGVKEIPLAAGAGTHCADLFDRMALPPELPENFLLNQADAATHVYGWLRGEGKETYEQALLRQHTVAALGPDGKRSYWNNGAPVPYSSDTTSPGIFRVDLARQTIQGDEFSLTAPELAQLAKYDYKPKPRLFPKIPGLAKNLTVPTNRYLGRKDMFTRGLPEGEAEKIYRAATSKQAEKVREWMIVPAGEARRRGDELAADLAQLYYLGIHWMPFDSINNSIFMAQINVVLRHHGFRTLEHGRLDYMALATPPDIFGKVFLEEFRKQNPQ